MSRKLRMPHGKRHEEIRFIDLASVLNFVSSTFNHSVQSANFMNIITQLVIVTCRSQSQAFCGLALLFFFQMQCFFKVVDSGVLFHQAPQNIVLIEHTIVTLPVLEDQRIQFMLLSWAWIERDFMRLSRRTFLRGSGILFLPCPLVAPLFGSCIPRS